MSTKTKLIIALIGIVVFIVVFMLYPKEFLFAVGGLLLIFVFAAGLRNKQRRSSGYDRRYDRGYDNEDYPYRETETHHYVHQKRICPNCRGTGRVERPLMPIQRGAPGIPHKPMMTCPRCNGARYVWD